MVVKKGFKDNWLVVFLSLLKEMRAPGLQAIKWMELHDNWSKLIPPEFKNQFKYYNEGPSLEL